MPKVYCKNCASHVSWQCWYEEKNPYTKEIMYEGKVFHNRQGDCPHYTRKWYKFWVKEN